MNIHAIEIIMQILQWKWILQNEKKSLVFTEKDYKDLKIKLKIKSLQLDGWPESGFKDCLKVVKNSLEKVCT